MTDPTPAGAVLAEVTRGAFVESTHFGHVAVVDGGSASRNAEGPGAVRVRTLPDSDPDVPVVCRSAIKSLQILPLLERGGAEEFGLTDRDIALMVASHEGTQDHVDAVADLLQRTGVAVDDLACGPHAPFSAPTRRAMLVRGEAPTRLHNNCSGKHAGFVLLARSMGLPPPASVDPEAAPQRAVREVVGAMAGVGPDAIRTAVDGCGAPTLQLPLASLAAAFRRLLLAAGPDGVNRAGVDGVRATACARVHRAIRSHPFFVAGEGRLCTALLTAHGDSVWPKNGAEGVYVCAVAMPCGDVAGIAVKVVDGATRGYQPLVARLVTELVGAREAAPQVRPFLEAVVSNTRREAVGAVRCAPRDPILASLVETGRALS